MGMMLGISSMIGKWEILILITLGQLASFSFSSLPPSLPLSPSLPFFFFFFLSFFLSLSFFLPFAFSFFFKKTKIKFNGFALQACDSCLL